MSSVTKMKRLLVCTLTILSVAGGTLWGAELVTDFDMSEQRWNEDDGIIFEGIYLEDGNNTWGNVQTSDFYMETTNNNSFTDIYLETDQIVDPTRLVKIEFDARYLTSNTHSFLSFGFDLDRENAVWFGFNNTAFFAGTGTDLDVVANQPSADLVAFSTDRTFEDDTRIGVRIGYDAPSQQLRNFQVDSDNDGNFETELLTAPVDLSAANLVPEEWLLVSYFGGTGARIDDISLRQLESFGDYNSDLDFDREDAELLCKGIATGNLAFDFDQDGEVNSADLSQYLMLHAASIIGDFDFNSEVAFADFLILSGNFGMDNAVYEDGDADCNGVVGFGDFLLLSGNFGLVASGSEPVGNVASVPEPGGQQLVGIFLLLGFLGRRQRRS